MIAFWADACLHTASKALRTISILVGESWGNSASRNALGVENRDATMSNCWLLNPRPESRMMPTIIFWGIGRYADPRGACCCCCCCWPPLTAPEASSIDRKSWNPPLNPLLCKIDRPILIAESSSGSIITDEEEDWEAAVDWRDPPRMPTFVPLPPVTTPSSSEKKRELLGVDRFAIICAAWAAYGAGEGLGGG